MTSRPLSIVTVGGGTGTFVVLSALKSLENVSLTAIVTSADSGGSSGRLRDAYGFLPAGDARQALVALAPDGDILRDVFAYRFNKSDVAGHNLGNLFLTALTDVMGSNSKAIEEASRILSVEGRVLSATEEGTTLCAELEDGTILEGEHHIDERVSRAPIKRVWLSNDPSLSEEAGRALEEADVIILGPGDLYTSTIAALLPHGAKERIAASSAALIYLMNLFTKTGQTDGYTASTFTDEVEEYAGRKLNHVVVHSGDLPEESLTRYAQEQEYPVQDDLGKDVRVVRANLASVEEVPALPEDPVPRSLVRHSPVLIHAALSPLLDTVKPGVSGQR